MDLINPDGYILPDGSERNENCNGCGADNWLGKLVPDRYPFCKGKDLMPACCRHDYQYEIGTTDRQKLEADLELFGNCLIILLDIKKDVLQILFKNVVDALEVAYSEKACTEAWTQFWDRIEMIVSRSKINWFKKWFRYEFAKKYYKAVEAYGHTAYWANKK